MNRIRGFTIIELMVTLVILGILVTVAAPSFRSQIERTSVDKVKENLYSDLVLARTEAMARSTPVTICPSTDPYAILPVCSVAANKTDWDTGWFVFSDFSTVGTVGQFEPANGEELIRVFANFQSNRMEISSNSAANRIRFDPRGANSNFSTFSFCNASIEYSEGIAITDTGRARYEGVVCP